ncbi:hypothetical protein [Psychroflexus halocasei]|uniref:Uncharacterized protein n=1 Tax=Psychroflexus halocasei TaxID=908615 RepID=A0A1H4CMC6_9FLAO|nr:hypothetical protein [Psychroflexus halocasei]SEA61468.1 hypothetical protein SAMN05421540_10872 [Psychroflexus halocasei]
MRTLIIIVFIIIALSFGVGFYIKLYDDAKMGEVIIGLSVLASSFILMPLFLYHRWKGKRLEDYTLTKEKMDKMKGKDL